MLAKIVNDDAGMRNVRGALWFFASKLAPTVWAQTKMPRTFRYGAFLNCFTTWVAMQLLPLRLQQRRSEP
ncbi:hypothetical protein CI807_10635 [Pseudomonas sp. NS1(2017)]|nr:hypothetical protein CI807_10635 [Pseudomonas sp. NS1(2017)]